MNRRGFLKFLGALFVIPFLPKCKPSAPKPVMGVDLAKEIDQTGVITWHHVGFEPKWASIYDPPKYEELLQMRQIQFELLDHMHSIGDIQIVTNPFCPKDEIIVMPGLDQFIKPWSITDLG